jgi:L-lactate dehydrogenase complex protein LldG
MSDSRRRILEALRGAQVDAAPLPPLDGIGMQFPDAWATFADVLQQVGGQLEQLRPGASLAEFLPATVPAFADAQRICSLVPDVLGNVKLADIDDPHQLADVDLVVARAHFAVAENGAVWCDDHDLPHRVLYFITRHLILLVDGRQIVHNMHQAYERLRFEEAGFGVFISGPSKTADIEQSLVIGAHGARSLTVVRLET